MEQISGSPASQNIVKAKRPKPVTIISVVGLMGVIFFFAGLLMPSARNQAIQQYGYTALLISIFSIVLSAIALVGYSRMRKWGVYLYTATTIFAIGRELVSGTYSGISGYIIPLVVIGVGFYYLKKMS